MQFPFHLLLLIFALLSAAAACAGILFSGVPEISRRAVLVSGLLLVLISAIWILPELASMFGWSAGLALMLVGASILWAVDRFIYPVCPACSHSHNHDACSARLHGFAAPSIIASVLHSVFDGWILAFGRDGLAHTAGEALSTSVVVHKLPEAFAFGVILRAALKSRTAAIGWALLAQAMMFAGAGLEKMAAPHIGGQLVAALLALGGGTFLYLGLHAVHSEWKRRVERAVRIS